MHLTPPVRPPPLIRVLGVLQRLRRVPVLLAVPVANGGAHGGVPLLVGQLDARLALGVERADGAAAVVDLADGLGHDAAGHVDVLVGWVAALPTTLVTNCEEGERKEKEREDSRKGGKGKGVVTYIPVIPQHPYRLQLCAFATQSGDFQFMNHQMMP